MQVLGGDLVYLAATLSLTGAWFCQRVVLGSECLAGRSARFHRPRRADELDGLPVSQTLIFTTVFYGYGLGAAFVWGPAQVVAFAVVVYALQVVLCATGGCSDFGADLWSGCGAA